MNSTEKQIRIFTKIMATACIASMVLSWQLWLNERNFPITPLFNFLPFFSHPGDYVLPLLSIVFLGAIAFLKFSKKIIIGFLIAATLLALLDMNRWQPWYYQYLLMFFILSFYNPDLKDSKHEAAIVVCFKIMISAIYFWSGLQKLNPNFIADTFPWLMEPITNRLGADSLHYFKWLGLAFPIIETITGILLLLPKTAKMGAVLAITMHVFILFTLGPLGHNYNFVVWPWNIFMITINWLLFFKSPPFAFTEFKSALKFHSIKFVCILFVMMPLFNFFNKWDSYLSHNLYSGNTSNGEVYISDSIKNKLPEHILNYVSGEDNKIPLKYWCMKELGVPPYPEKRNFKAIANTFYQYTNNKSEVYFEFTPKIKVEM